MLNIKIDFIVEDAKLLTQKSLIKELKEEKLKKLINQRLLLLPQLKNLKRERRKKERKNKPVLNNYFI